MRNYGQDKSGKKLSQQERIDQALAQHRKNAKPKSEPAVPQRFDTRKAEREGRKEAQAKMAAPPDPNPYKRQYRELEARGALTPQDQRQLQRFKRWSKRWEVENAERIANEKRVAELQSTPEYQNALEHSLAFMRTPPHIDDATAAAAAYGYLNESGDVQGYWSKVAEIEHARWAEEDAKTMELAKNSVTARAALSEQAERSEQAAARLREAQEKSGNG